MSASNSIDIDALRRSIEDDRRQLAELTERIARQEAELAAALSSKSLEGPGGAEGGAKAEAGAGAGAGAEVEEESTTTIAKTPSPPPSKRAKIDHSASAASAAAADGTADYDNASIPTKGAATMPTETSAAMRANRPSNSQVDGTSIIMEAADDDEEYVISKVLSCNELMLLGSAIFPYLDDINLCKSAVVSRHWKGSSEADALWKDIVSKKWPDLVSTLVKAGLIGSQREDIRYLAFYRSRMRPQIARPPTTLISGHEDELYVLIDMPNLVLADATGEVVRPLKPVHVAFTLSESFRDEETHQQIYEAATCDCDATTDLDEHSHPDSWLHFPFDEDAVYTANPDICKDWIPPPEQVFQLNVSLMRKSDGKIMKLLESSSDDCEIEAPDGYSDPWVMHKQKLGSMPNHLLREPGELRSVAAVVAEGRNGDFDGDVSETAFKLTYVIFGLEMENDFHHMVPMGLSDKLSMFLMDMARLEWN